jgi:DNA-binding NarL/FixJ family response regulator
MKNGVPKTDPITQRADEAQASLRRVFVGPLDFNPKRIQVIKLVSEGLQDKEVADKMNFSVSAVKWYLRGIYSQLNFPRHSGGCLNRISLAMWARSEGVV